VWTLLIRPMDGWLLVAIDAAAVTISAARALSASSERRGKCLP